MVMCQKGFGLRTVHAMQLQVPRKPRQQMQGMCRAEALSSSSSKSPWLLNTWALRVDLRT